MQTREVRSDALNQQRRIGAMLRESREQRGMLQRELAQRLGVHFTNIAKWEAGAVSVPRRRVRQLEEALGVSLEEVSGAVLTVETPIRAKGAARSRTRKQLDQRKCVGDWWVKRIAELNGEGLMLGELDAIEYETLEGAAAALDRSGANVANCPDKRIENVLDSALQLARVSRIADTGGEERTAA